MRTSRPTFQGAKFKDGRLRALRTFHCAPGSSWVERATSPSPFGNLPNGMGSALKWSEVQFIFRRRRRSVRQVAERHRLVACVTHFVCGVLTIPTGLRPQPWVARHELPWVTHPKTSESVESNPPRASSCVRIDLTLFAGRQKMFAQRQKVESAYGLCAVFNSQMRSVVGFDPIGKASPAPY